MILSRKWNAIHLNEIGFIKLKSMFIITWFKKFDRAANLVHSESISNVVFTMWRTFTIIIQMDLQWGCAVGLKTKIQNEKTHIYSKSYNQSDEIIESLFHRPRMPFLFMSAVT